MVLVAALLCAGGCAPRQPQPDADPGGPEPSASRQPAPTTPYVAVLGVGQDGGIPQVGSWGHPGWDDPSLRRRVASLGLVDPASGRRWLFDATPDFREQLTELARLEPRSDEPLGGLAGVFLTHAHVGHYAGLLFLGHEVIGARGVPVHVMPRFADYLRSSGPWDQLVRYDNVALEELADGKAVALGEGLSVTPFLVPHRQEYSEVVGFRIDGPDRSALYLPDIDSWQDWDARGVALEDVLATVDVAYLDATFFADGEIEGRDMSGFPHPFIRHTMERLAAASPELRSRVRFIHLNHTNPAQYPDSEARQELESAGFRVAEQGEVVSLGAETAAPDSR